MQEKIDCNNLNEIREERNVNSIYIGLATSRAYVQFSSNPIEIFHCLSKSFTDFEHTLGSLKVPTWDFPLCSKILQETTHLLIIILTIQETTILLITTDFLRWTERFLSFRVDDKNWIS